MQFATLLNVKSSLGKLLLLVWAMLLCIALPVLAADTQYQVEITVVDNFAQATSADTVAIKSLLEKHLQIIEWRDNPRTTAPEWQRLFEAAPQNIKNLLATEGYFSPTIASVLDKNGAVSIAKFTVNIGKPAIISSIDIQFTGAINQAVQNVSPNITTLRNEWLLAKGEIFRQEYWTQAKRRLLTNLLLERYPNASISNSLAEVNVENSTVALKVEVNSGDEVHFGELNIAGLERYSTSVVKNLNPIKPNAIYTQTDLLTFQARLQESGYFSNVEVTADTKAANADNQHQAPIKVTVEENKSIKMGVGVGYIVLILARVPSLLLKTLIFLDVIGALPAA